MPIEEQLENMLKSMLITQARLNEKTNGKFYITNKYRTENTNKFIYYPMCIKMEVAELVDSLPWKHWKHANSAYDMDNIKVELIDILHFALSIHIDHIAATKEDITTKPHSATDIVNHYLDFLSKEESEVYKLNTFKQIVTNVDESLNIASKNIINLEMEPYIGLMHYSDIIMQFRMDRDANCIRVLYEAILNMYGIIKLIEQPLMTPIDLSFYINEVINLYNGKVALNRLRQDYGYTDGTYKKIWELPDGKYEDNVYMLRNVFEAVQAYSEDEMYNILHTEYLNQTHIKNDTELL